MSEIKERWGMKVGQTIKVKDTRYTRKEGWQIDRIMNLYKGKLARIVSFHDSVIEAVRIQLLDSDNSHHLHYKDLIAIMHKPKQKQTPVTFDPNELII